MQLRMKERKGVANRLASSLAEAVARLPSKRGQRYRWAGGGGCQRHDGTNHPHPSLAKEGSQFRA
jgi:hypothetical protein